MGGRACSICSFSGRASVDARLAAKESYRRVASAFGLSASALKRHVDAGHVAEAAEARAEAQEQAQSTSQRIRDMDDRISALTFAPGAGTRAQIEVLRDHGIHLLRRSEARGDDRSAIAAAAVVQRALDALTELDQQSTADDAGEGCPQVIIYSKEWTEGPPEWLTRQLPGVKVWLPDNQRGDSMLFNGQRDDSAPDGVL